MRIVNIVGARPNFIKIAPIMAAWKNHPGVEATLVHTGQHYDEKMSDLFFRQLGIPKPDINLEIGSGSHAVQTAGIMTVFERTLQENPADAVLVVGDVNSTIACGIVAVKMGVKLVHVEAGLRSFDRAMPEEINRVLTDSISDLLFCTERSGVENLLREGIGGDRVHLVGNVMIDTLLRNRARAAETNVLGELGLAEDGYGVVTLHRPSNVDSLDRLRGIFSALNTIAAELPLVFPIHPRTRKNAEAAGLLAELGDRIRIVEPVGYLEFLRLVDCARVILSDSGGIQEECTVLKTPCLTLRENTERPSTVEAGANRLVGSDPDAILAAFADVMKSDPADIATPPLWDGRAAERIAAKTLEMFG